MRGAGADQRLFEPRAGSVSLEDLIVGTWDELVGSGSAGCPVCHGRMRRASGLRVLRFGSFLGRLPLVSEAGRL